MADCVVCKQRIPWGRNKNDFCSKKCELVDREYEDLRVAELERHNTTPREKLQARTGRKILVLGDTHFPWADKASIDLAVSIAEDWRPEIIIQVGDLFDFFSQAKFPKLLSITPRDEAKQGRDGAEEMWHRLGKAAPFSKRIQIKGNHDDRPYKRMVERLPEIEPFIDNKTIFEFPHVETVHDSREEVIVDGICFMHGYKKFGEHVKHNLMPTVCGHLHQAAIHYLTVRGEMIYEFNVGYMADPTQKALAYTQQKWVRWTQGVGLIDERGPRFIPTR